VRTTSTLVLIITTLVLSSNGMASRNKRQLSNANRRALKSGSKS